ncbi:MAG: hypothetical protein V4710_22410, partial [Verrucomicrobiota bacterium]
DPGNIFVTFHVPANRSAFIETSSDLAAWTLWNVPGNAGLPQPGGTVTLGGPKLGSGQFFRLRLREN